MKNNILLSIILVGIIILIVIINVNSVSAQFYGGYKGSDSQSSSSIYNLRYQGDPNEPSTSYYSGYWNSGSQSSSSSSKSVKTFGGPYTQAHVIKTTYPKEVPSSSVSYNYFRGESYPYYGSYSSGGYLGRYGYSGYSLGYGYSSYYSGGYFSGYPSYGYYAYYY